MNNLNVKKQREPKNSIEIKQTVSNNLVSSADKIDQAADESSSDVEAINLNVNINRV